MYLSVKDAAKMLGLSEETIRIKIRTGKLKAKKFKRLHKILEDDLYDMVRADLSDNSLSNDEVKAFIKAMSTN